MSVFKPTDVDQLDVLTTAMEAQNLEVFDTPVDYDVTYEGDYYQDPSIPEEQITWQYAVVPPNFQFPSGIQYETLAQIHIPGNDYTAVETEAERLAQPSNMLPNSTRPQPNVLQCDVDSHWDYSVRACVPNNCPVGYSWNGTSCQPDTPPPTSTPPAPAADAGVPGGAILVYDTQTQSDRAVRKATIVARRWFKIERGFTDNNGHYQLTKRFKNKVRINVKFTNSDAEVRGLRGIRLWQMFFPIKKTLGVYSGDKSNISYTFPLYTDPGSKGNRYWAGATTHNAVQDYRDYAPQEGIGQPPTGIKIMLTNLVSSAATPMYRKRGVTAIAQEFIYTYLSNDPNYFVAGIAAAINVLGRQIDIAVSYQYPTSDALKETAYHELTHAAHYAALGNSWYGYFATAEINTLLSTDNAHNPYGQNTGTYHDVIALGESWAYYMGHYLADKEYGVTYSGNTQEQGNTYSNNYPLYGLSSHLNLLEDFSPYRTYDPFYWIPQGVFYDLNDNRNDFQFNPSMVNDNVSGYTNQQMFNAFNSNITDLQGYRTNLLQQNGNNQSAEVINLFNQYGY